MTDRKREGRKKGGREAEGERETETERERMEMISFEPLDSAVP